MPPWDSGVKLPSSTPRLPEMCFLASRNRWRRLFPYLVKSCFLGSEFSRLFVALVLACSIMLITTMSHTHMISRSKFPPCSMVEHLLCFECLTQSVNIALRHYLEMSPPEEGELAPSTHLNPLRTQQRGESVPRQASNMTEDAASWCM